MVSAGVFASAPIAELDEAAWRKTMAVNVDSVATLYRAVIRCSLRRPSAAGWP